MKPSTISTESNNKKRRHDHPFRQSSLVVSASIAGILSVMMLWDFAAMLTDNNYVLPRLGTVLKRLLDMISAGELNDPVVNSFLTIMKGYLIGVVCGTGMGILSSHKIGGAFFSPYSTIIRATPVASLILLSYFWLATEYVPTFIAALMVTPIVWQSVQSSLRRLDRKMLVMCRLYRLSFLRTIRLYIAPEILPGYMSSLLTSVGLAFKAGIAAEVICHPKNTLGLALYNSKTYLEITDMYALTLVVILMSITIEIVFRHILLRIVTKGKNE